MAPWFGGSEFKLYNSGLKLVERLLASGYVQLLSFFLIQTFILQIVDFLDHPNLVKMFERFTYMGYQCLVFEMVHKDLFHRMDIFPDRIPPSVIRPVAKQLFMALEELLMPKLLLGMTCSHMGSDLQK